MSIMENSIHSNSLSTLSQRAGSHVTSAIKQASARTGVDFAYLMNQAAVESSFKPDAKAKTSSAVGLYQFIEKTWMGMVKTHGDKYGLGHYADQIDNKGRVADPKIRKEILSLRNDPQIAASMAAELAADNRCYLQKNTSCDVGATELYLAHFMGAGGASGFLNAMKKNPLQAAANIFPEAANANRAVFYNKSGAPRSLAEVYDVFAKKFEGVNTPPPSSLVPQNGTTPLDSAPLRTGERDQGRGDSFDVSALLDNSANNPTYPPPLSSPLYAGGGREKNPIWQQWSTPSPAFTRSSLSVDPVEIMLLAQIEKMQ